jgi:hypothetical protein
MEQQGVDGFFIVCCKRKQLVGKCEYRVEVLKGKDFILLFRYPCLFFHKLTLGTMPVSTGVKNHPGMPALTADFHTAPQI